MNKHLTLTKSQTKVIDLLWEQYLSSGKKQPVIDFVAPTGTGKTFMATYFISKIFAHNTNSNNLNKIMVVIATVSDAQLPRAFTRKINEYKSSLCFQNFEVEFRESPSASKKNTIEHIEGFHLKNNKVLIFGTASFGKRKIFTEQGILDNFIEETKKTNCQIIYIRDEAHRGGATARETAEKYFYEKFDNRLIELASFTIQMTATPKGVNNLIELKEEDLAEDGVFLLKNRGIYNPFSKNTQTSKELIIDAIEKFKEIQQEYEKLSEFIRPALLIQVSSRSKNITEEEYQAKINLVLNQLKEHNFKYLKYFSNDIEGNAKEDQTLQAASQKDSQYDAIIFKVGPATGWDIPRACMLLQIREISSEILNQQTLGRIKRNPIKGLKFNKITDKYYLYSNYQESHRKLIFYKLKKPFHSLKLYQGNIILNKKIENNFNKNYKKEFKKFLLSKKNFLEENSKKFKLPIEHVKYFSKTGTFNSYNHFAYSIFRLKIWNETMKNQYQKYFPKFINIFLNNYAKELKISPEIIIYTLIYQYISELTKIYNKCYNKQKKYHNYQIVPNKNLLNHYQMWIDKENKNIVDVSNFINYGYEKIQRVQKNNFLLKDKENSKKEIHYLDSSPEKAFLSEIFTEIEEENYYAKIFFFAKMPTFGSQIYFEYINDDDNEKHRAYIDFALVQKNLQNQKKVLMIEVKSWNDYDQEKTKRLLFAFQQYKKKNLFPIELMICYSGNSKKSKITFLDEHNNFFSKSIRKTLKSFFTKFQKKD